MSVLEVPDWIRYRGGDCRAFDRRLGREVFGPSHDFAHATDLIITNGSIRGWVGGLGLPPYLNVQAVGGGQWHEVGCLQFGEEALHVGRPRLVELTADVVTLSVIVEEFGDLYVTLKRGERGFRCSLPSVALAAAWRGTPPATGTHALNGTGRFGTGLSGGQGDALFWEDSFAVWSDSRFTWTGDPVSSDLRLLWHQAADSWASTFWLIPARSVVDNTDGAGYVTIFDDNGARVAEAFLDTDGTIKFRMGSTTIESDVQTFEAGDELLIGLCFSRTEGMTLLIRDENGTVQHYAEPTAIDPITSGYLASVVYAHNETNWGDGNWGDGVWGGVTTYADGVIDNHKLFDGTITDDEFETLATANAPLDGLPEPESRLVWFAPFDAIPIPSFAVESSGRVVDTDIDDAGFIKALVYRDAGHLEVGALLATAAAGDSVAEQHAAFSMESQQEVRVR